MHTTSFDADFLNVIIFSAGNNHHVPIAAWSAENKMPANVRGILISETFEHEKPRILERFRSDEVVGFRSC